MQISLRDAIKKATEIEKDVTDFYKEKMAKAEYPGSKKLLEYISHYYATRRVNTPIRISHATVMPGDVSKSSRSLSL